MFFRKQRHSSKKKSKRRPFSLSLEQLEDRVMLDGGLSAQLANGGLSVIGNEQNDNIIIRDFLFVEQPVGNDDDFVIEKDWRW